MVAATASGRCSPCVERLLASLVPQLRQCSAVRILLSEHAVDELLLDFLVSSDGERLLKAYRDQFLVPVACGAAAAAVEAAAPVVAPGVITCTADDISPGAPVVAAEANLGAASVAAPAAAVAKAGRLRGRQKIAAEDRLRDGHYFKPPRSLGAKAAKPATPPTKPRPAPQTVSPIKPKQASGQKISEVDVETYTGTVKSVLVDKGFGFIRCENLEQDVYFRSSIHPPGVVLEPGDLVEFEMRANSQDRPQARTVLCLEKGSKQSAARIDSDRRYFGLLKSAGGDYGFFTCEEASQEYSRDVYISRMYKPEGGWRLEQEATFQMSLNSQGMPQAKNVEWGPEPPSSDEGDGERRSSSRDSCGSNESEPSDAEKRVSEPVVRESKRW